MPWRCEAKRRNATSLPKVKHAFVAEAFQSGSALKCTFKNNLFLYFQGCHLVIYLTAQMGYNVALGVRI